MNTTVLEEILAFLFGRKYYANVIMNKSTAEQALSSFIFKSKEDAEKHREKLKFNMTFQYIETIKFRSREIDANCI